MCENVAPEWRPSWGTRRKDCQWGAVHKNEGLVSKTLQLLGMLVYNNRRINIGQEAPGTLWKPVYDQTEWLHEYSLESWIRIC